MTVIAGRYRLLDLLAEAATGAVWRARDEDLGRDVAVKEVHAPPGLGEADERLLYERIAREARSATGLRHPGIARVDDVVVARGRPWVVMELIPGLTLAETVEADGPMPPGEAARIGAAVLAALRAAREAGVPHRDLGADRVLLANDGRIVVTGFGTATGAAAREGRAREAGAPGQADELRALGALLRTAVGGAGIGPLATLIGELLREDPDDPTPVERVERELRRLASGGPAAGAPSPAPYGPGDGGRGTRRDRTDGDGDERGGDATAAAEAPPTERRPERAPAGPRWGAVLFAGLLGALLLVAALVFHFVR
ncbi:protein kinase [Streptomyces sp. NPDC126503]|uniref:protein kinase domain-containing protein n=1 Tax=Streptomyces sp. NPDC126503 TaxID=3155315 RepID=UPI00331E4FFA